MSREQAPGRTLRRSELVFHADGRVETSFLWDEAAAAPSSPVSVPALPERYLPLLTSCRICPHDCGVNRLAGERGRCRAGARVKLSRWGPELGEEDFLVGPGGSGVVFFADCHLTCVFCHNFEATQHGVGIEVDTAGLAEIVLDLASRGCSNVHFISPTHYAPQVADVLAPLRPDRLRLPVVYNCSGYESVAMLAKLDGLVDIYIPDFKFGPEDDAEGLAGAPNYFDRALEAIAEMARQVGALEIGPDGLARRGLLVRHLVMPGRVESSKRILEAIKREIGPETAVHLMASYHPAFRAFESPVLARRTTRDEYLGVAEFALRIGIARVVVD